MGCPTRSAPPRSIALGILVLDLVLTSAHLTALGGTEAGPKPRFSPQNARPAGIELLFSSARDRLARWTPSDLVHVLEGSGQAPDGGCDARKTPHSSARQGSHLRRGPRRGRRCRRDGDSRRSARAR